MYTHTHKYLQTYIHIHTHQTLEGMCSYESCRLKGKIMSLIFHTIGFLFLVRTREQQARAVSPPRELRHIIKWCV